MDVRRSFSYSNMPYNYDLGYDTYKSPYNDFIDNYHSHRLDFVPGFDKPVIDSGEVTWNHNHKP